MVSILFGSSLSWPWLVQTPDASAQIFAFMPNLLSSALNLSTGLISTVALQAYQPQTFNETNNNMLSLWLGYVPATSVSYLAAQIKTPSSPLYTNSSGIQHELAMAINPTLPITAFSSTSDSSTPSDESTGGASSSSSSSATTSTSTVGAVVGSFGAVVLLVGAALTLKTRRRRMAEQVSSTSQSYGATMSQPATVGGLRQLVLGSDGRRISTAGAPVTSFAHSRTTSAETRNSWWRYSDPSDQSHSETSSSSSHNQPRRIGSSRIAAGERPAISKPYMNMNSLML
ncbi:uncharacterized protein L969DRAFT_568086 [Mixia osmundae IAM 14324]|nr:uncharacterized protein L969DRAFT_568086 [Mixia osmundae IAM 14324]KEI38107.1 hypothetical protein L969DRAFT_568086 [Mixia osmundae IAM 14324]